MYIQVRKLAWNFGGLTLAPALDELGLRSVSVLISTRNTDSRVMPQLRRFARYAGQGVSIKAVLPLDKTSSALSSLSRRLQRVMGGATRVHLVAPLGYKTLTMSAHTPDLWLGGQGGAGAASGLLRGSSASMIDPRMRVVVDEERVLMEFEGDVLLPVTEGETLKLKGALRVNAQAQTLLLLTYADVC